MPNIRSKSGIFISGIVLVLATGFFAYYYPRIQAERQNDEFDAITAGFTRRISDDSWHIAQPNLVAVCIAERRQIGESFHVADARPEILARLKKQIPKIQPYAYCKTLQPESKFRMYWLDSFKQESSNDATVVIGFRDSFNSIYSDGTIIKMKKRSEQWEVDAEMLSWMA